MEQSLVVTLKVDPRDLAEILSTDPGTVENGATMCRTFDFGARPDITRDLSPIRGPIRTPAASLAHAPVLAPNLSASLRSRFPTSKRLPGVEAQQVAMSESVEAAGGIEEKQDHTNRSREPTTQCAGCRTVEFVKLGLWIMEVPTTDTERDLAILDRYCIHKLRCADRMAAAMLKNAQGERKRLEAEHANLQARRHAQSQSRQGDLPQDSRSRSQLPPNSPPSVQPQTTRPPAGDQAVAPSSQPVPRQHQRPAPDTRANMAYFEVFHQIKRRAPDFPDEHLKKMLKFLFNEGRIHLALTQPARTSHDGASRAGNSGFIKGWEAHEENPEPGASEELTKDDLKILIKEACYKRDAVVRGVKELNRIIKAEDNRPS